MRLSEIPFEKSIEIEMTIAPIAERIMEDVEIADVFNRLYGTGQEEDTKTRIKLSKEFTKCLFKNHLDDICEMVGALNEIPPQEVKSKRRGVVVKYINDILLDRETISFFMSSEALAQAAQSAISQMPDEESLEV